MRKLRLREVCQTHGIWQRHEQGTPGSSTQWQVPRKAGWRVRLQSRGMEG